LPKLGKGYLSKVKKFHQFLMCRNVASEMSRDRNGQTEKSCTRSCVWCGSLW